MILKAINHRDNGDFFEAERIFEDLINEEGVCYNEYKFKSDLYNELSLVYIKQNNYRKAKAVLLKAVGYNSRHASSLANLGLCERVEKNYKSAIYYLRLAIDLDPTNYQFLHNLGNLYEKIGELTLAQKNFDQALAINPKNHVTRYARARIILFKNKIKEAIEEYIAVADKAQGDERYMSLVDLACLFWIEGKLNAFCAALNMSSDIVKSESKHLKSHVAYRIYLQEILIFHEKTARIF